MSSPVSYRPDVDGLRAIAVSSVLAFHAFPAALPGGFVGVDIFFVISGFLITGIIQGGLAKGSFTFRDFYARRIRRIFPALVLVLIASLAFGWIALLPNEFRALGKHVVAGAGFISNLLLWSEVDYFDTAAELKPLLHLWSLGIEEQYYVVWPVILFLLRSRLPKLFWILAGLGIASFIYSLVLIDTDRTAAFYSPLARFWELAVGGTLAYAARFGTHGTPWNLPPSLTQFAASLGLALIVFALVVLNRDTAFPGAWAVLPVLGTAFVIAAGPTGWVNRLLSVRPVVFIGLISYPLYLWHWPLLTYARIVAGGEPSLVTRIGALCASVLLAWLTYRFVELHFRRPADRSRARLLPRPIPTLVASMCVVGVIALSIFARLIPSASAASPQLVEIADANADWTYDRDRTLKGDVPETVIFVGDSHMQQYWPRLAAIAKTEDRPKRTIVIRTRGGCAPLPAIDRRGRGCANFVDETLKLAAAPEVSTVVFAASWYGLTTRNDLIRAGDPSETPISILAPENSWAMREFETALASLVARGKRVVLVLSSPRGDAFDPRRMIAREGVLPRAKPTAPVPRHELETMLEPMDESLRIVAQRVGATVVEPMDYLCDANACPTVDANGRPLYKDDSHIRARVVREEFNAFDEFIYLRPVASRAPAH